MLKKVKNSIKLLLQKIKLNARINYKKRKEFVDLSYSINRLLRNSNFISYYVDSTNEILILKVKLNKQEFGQLGSTRKIFKMINLLDAANFLIRCYYKVSTEYKCVRPKIEKLLVIASLVYIRNNRENLFSEDIDYKSCGLGFNQLENFLVMNILDGTVDSTRIEDEFNENVKIPVAYLGNDFCDNINALLIDVFREFGAFGSKELGLKIDEFKKELFNEKKEFDMLKTVNFLSGSLRHSSKRYQTNNILLYIFNYLF